MKNILLILTLLYIFTCVSMASASSYVDIGNPTTVGGVAVNKVYDPTAPNQSATTWNVTFDGSNKQWVGWEKSLTAFPVRNEDVITVSGNYKIDNPFNTSYCSIYVCNSSRSPISNKENLTYIADNQWHSFSLSTTLNANETNPILEGFQSPMGGEIHTGNLKMNNMSAVISRTVPTIIFLTTGSTFAPVINVSGSPTVLWTFEDGTTSNSTTPSKNYGSSAMRSAALIVTPWSTVTSIVVGYDEYDMGKNYSIPLAANQYVSNVIGLENVNSSLQYWASSYSRIPALDFSNFTSLIAVESYHDYKLKNLTVANTPNLARVCIETCNVSYLDFSQSPKMEDIRAARQTGGTLTIYWGNAGQYLYHLCEHDMKGYVAPPPFEQFPVLKEASVDRSHHTGNLKLNSTNMSFVQAFNNSYTSANFSGCFPYYNGTISVYNNNLTSLDVSDCPAIKNIFAYNNELNQSEVDKILQTVDSYHTTSGTLDLTGNAAPSSVGVSHAQSLITRKWKVNVSDFEKTIPVPPVANFTANKTEGFAPLDVQFNDLSENATSVSWDFGDGSNSAEENPVHEFTTAGTFTVNLTATNGNGTDSKLATINVVDVVPASTMLNFTNGGGNYNIDVINPGNGKKFQTYLQLGPDTEIKYAGNITNVVFAIPDDSTFVNLSSVTTFKIQFWRYNGTTYTCIGSTDELKSQLVYGMNNITLATPIAVQAGDNYGLAVGNTLTPTVCFDYNTSSDYVMYYKGTASVVGNSYNFTSSGTNYGNKVYRIGLQGTKFEKTIPVLPVANFTANKTEGFAPLNVQFNDLSENATSVSWDFGDGSNSAEENPVHEFTTAGTFTVNLTATNGNGTDSKLATINVVDVVPASTMLNFTNGGGNYNIDVINPGNGKKFQTYLQLGPDTEIKYAGNITNVVFAIPDDSTFVNLSSVTTFKIQFWRYNGTTYTCIGSTDELKSQLVYGMNNITLATPIAVQAGDNYGLAVGNTLTPTVCFDYNTSSDYVMYYKGTASVVGNSYNFTSSGTNYGNKVYRIGLQGTEFEKTIPVPPVANFTANKTEGFAPLDVQFNDLSENATSVSWDFGDGSNSAEENPVHEFTTAGTFTVNLTATNGNGTDSKLATINVVDVVPASTMLNFTNGGGNYNIDVINPGNGKKFQTYLQLGPDTEIKYAGNITNVVFAIPDDSTFVNLSSVTTFKIQFWRYNGTTYTCIGSTDELKSQLVYGMNNITLATPIAVQAGDNYGLAVGNTLTPTVCFDYNASSDYVMYYKGTASVVGNSYNFTSSGTNYGNRVYRIGLQGTKGQGFLNLTIMPRAGMNFVSTKDTVNISTVIPVNSDSCEFVINDDVVKTTILPNSAEFLLYDFSNVGAYNITAHAVSGGVDYYGNLTLFAVDGAQAAPYVGTHHTSGTLVGNDTYYLQTGYTTRIRQTGNVSAIGCAVYNINTLQNFTLMFWRDNGQTYDLIGTSKNLNSSFTTDGYNVVKLQTPIPVQEGDYYGCYMKNVNKTFYTLNDDKNFSTKYTDSVTSSYAWDNASAITNNIMDIDIFMSEFPDYVFVGDSIISGYPAYRSYADPQGSDSTDNIQSSIAYQFRNITGATYQNMGISGQRSDQIRTRFMNDVLYKRPSYVLIEGGYNDYKTNRTAQDTIDDISYMVNTSAEWGISPVVFEILPTNNVNAGGTVEIQMTRDIVNNYMETAYGSIYPAINGRKYVGIYNTSGPEGNLWNIQPTYASPDGYHYTVDGYRVLAQAMYRGIEAQYVIYYSDNINCTIDNTGKITYNKSISPNETKLPHMYIKPDAGNVRVAIIKFNSDKDDIIWTESSEDHSTTTQHIIGDFPSNTPIQINRDGVSYAIVNSNSTGYIDWVYDGGYSEHTFEVTPVTINTTTGPVTNGLIVYYNGSLSGKSLVDLSGNNNTGYATNVTQETNQSTDVNYISLGGVNSKIDISNNVQTNVSSPISIEFIGSINTFSKYGALVSKYKGSDGGWYLSCSSSAPYNHARFGAILKDIGLKFYESNVSLVAGQVYDIVATYDNNVTHIYVNGVDSGSKTWNSPISGITNNISIGYGSGLNYSNCSMYTFRLYNRSLSPAEVLQNYNNGLWRYTIKATPTITWSNPATITYGTALSGTQLNANTPVPGSFVYNPASGTILGAGTQTLQTTFMPTDPANYTTASSSVSLRVNKATPLITWSNPSAVDYGTVLSGTQLSASASVPGSFVYTPASGTVIYAGNHALQVTFTPADTTNYTTASSSVSLIVNKATPLITWSNPANITYGTLLSTTQLDASASVQGSLIYTPALGTVLSAGTHTLHVDFTPADASNYNNATADATINVSETTRTTPIITWSNPAAIIYGTVLSETQLNANASVPGSFVYNPVSGTILGAGTQTLQTTFTPTDSTNYTTATSSVSLTVNKATPLITWSNPADITYGTSLSETQLNASSSVPGSFVYDPASGSVLSEGTHTLHVDFTPTDATNYTIASSGVSINVVNSATAKSSSGSNNDGLVKQKVLEPNNTQPLNSIENIGKNLESESGNKTIVEYNTSNKGLQTEQKESQIIPGFEIYFGIVYLLGVFLYKRK